MKPNIDILVPASSLDAVFEWASRERRRQIDAAPWWRAFRLRWRWRKCRIAERSEL